MGNELVLALDATVLSNFSSTQILDLIVEEAVVKTSKEIRDEILSGYEQGYQFLEQAVKLTHNDEISVPHGNLHPDILNGNTSVPVPDFADSLDLGEGTLILMVESDKLTLQSRSDVEYIVGSDDKDAREVLKSRGHSITGSIGLLCFLVNRDQLDVQEADDHLSSWIKDRGYRSPVESISETLVRELTTDPESS